MPEQIFRHLAAREHSGLGVEQPQLGLDAREVSDPGGDAGRGVVTERVEVDEVEAALGLGGGLIVVALASPGRRERPLAGARVVAPVA